MMAYPRSKRMHMKRWWSDLPTGGAAGDVEGPQSHPRFPNAVLAATDASAEARAALLVAADLCQVTESRLEVVYVWREPQQAAFYSETLPLPVRRAFQREALGVLAAEVAYLRSTGARVAGSHLRYGDPSAEILRLAAQLETDTVVIGSRTHGALRRLVMGSVVEQIAARSPRPVLVARNVQSCWPPAQVAVAADPARTSLLTVCMTAALVAAHYHVKVRLIAPLGRGDADLGWARPYVEHVQRQTWSDIEVERGAPTIGLRGRLQQLAAEGALVASAAPPGSFRYRVIAASGSLRLLREYPASVLVVPAG